MSEPVTALSVVVVNWNTRDLLRGCLESVFREADGLQLEVWVVDNASSDRSCEMVAECFPDARLIRNSENRGFAAANNQALRAAQGKYTLLLNSDTVVLENVLSRSVAYMDDHPAVAVLGCRVLNPDGSMQPTCFQDPTLLNLTLKVLGLFRLRWPKWFGKEHMSHWPRDTERDVDVVTGCYMMVRRTAIDEVGLLDEEFFFCGEESDWCRRFRKAGWKIRFAPIGEIIHHGNASGRRLSYKRDILLTQGLVLYHKKHGGQVAAIVAWALLAVFTLLRVAAWTVISAKGDTDARRRRTHFAMVLKGFGRVWPWHKRGASLIEP